MAGERSIRPNLMSQILFVDRVDSQVFTKHMYLFSIETIFYLQFRFYRFRLLQFRVLQIPTFTIPTFTDSCFYNSRFYRFRLLQFRVLQIPAFTILGFTDYGFYNSRFSHSPIPFLILDSPFQVYNNNGSKIWD